MQKYKKVYRIKIKDLPAEERPRERLLMLGSDALSNAELLSLIISVGSKKENALNLANRLLANHDLGELSQISAIELKKLFGINDAKAAKILASIELGKRTASNNGKKRLAIESPEDLASLFMGKMQNLKKEVLNCVCLDSKCRILKNDTIAIGGLNAGSVHTREIFRTAILEAAAGIVLVHNHPSGDPKPSARDVDLTKKAARAGRLLGIELLDHIIIGDGAYVSLKEAGSF